ncbi:hypothetical protein RRG08_036024 [Elysia crispata]|uniref:Uncharacterized protein n=1 Tax=Elysia crispata TaxID=231223 RepID=A0AAE1AM54_9GAST|nr:hypothetical protein RRG08_036024 [Elysia crispata]
MTRHFKTALLHPVNLCECASRCKPLAWKEEWRYRGAPPGYRHLCRGSGGLKRCRDYPLVFHLHTDNKSSPRAERSRLASYRNDPNVDRYHVDRFSPITNRTRPHLAPSGGCSAVVQRYTRPGVWPPNLPPVLSGRLVGVGVPGT